jgi:hypothetical protein
MRRARYALTTQPRMLIIEEATLIAIMLSVVIRFREDEFFSCEEIKSSIERKVASASNFEAWDEDFELTFQISRDQVDVDSLLNILKDFTMEVYKFSLCDDDTDEELEVILDEKQRVYRCSV